MNIKLILKNIGFWLKFLGLLLIVVFVVFLGVKSKEIFEGILQLFGFSDAGKNTVIVDAINRVKNNTGRTVATIDFLSEIKKKYGNGGGK